MLNRMLVGMCLLAGTSVGAASCIVSGDTARSETGRQASAASEVVGGGAASAGAASGTALETRVRTEATAEEWIPLDTRAPRGLVLILS